MSRLLFCLLAALAAFASPKVTMLSVEAGVQLEVLDFGGSGRPVFLLAGFLTAHTYESLGDKLSAFGHVYAITRRGLGASTQTESGCDAIQSSRDILAAMDALKLTQKPVLIGHSYGGQDLNTLAELNATRIAGIVYLNSAEDATLGLDDYGSTLPEASKLPSAKTIPADKSSLAAYSNWQKQTTGVAFPEAELRQLFKINSDGSLGAYLVPKRVIQAMSQGIRKPKYSSIKIPALAFFVEPPSLEKGMKRLNPSSEGQREAVQKKNAFDLAVYHRHRRDFAQGVPTAKVVELKNANFYIFFSNEAEIVDEIRSFLASL